MTAHAENHERELNERLIRLVFPVDHHNLMTIAVTARKAAGGQAIARSGEARRATAECATIVRMNTDCVVYRCSKQDQMYLYLRAGLDPSSLPEALRQRTGRFTEVMQLTLSPERKLARVDVTRVILRLQGEGWFLQMPPDGQIRAKMNDSD